MDPSRRFYRDVLGLAIYREFGPPDDRGRVAGEVVKLQAAAPIAWF